MSLNFPVEGSGPGGCHFGKGLDLEVLNATSDHDALNVAITDILSSNMLDLRTEIVQEMESGLCRNLLEPRAQQPKFMHKPMGKGESMWPLVLGTIFLFFAMLVANGSGAASPRLHFQFMQAVVQTADVFDVG
ncbi:unnamed protein product [Symbiodinium sp. KB8]|nr:unnamed protein product [Symbiodinium sp. KB8]